MFLESIELHNIRSYTNETIEFPKGMTLLSGDIGSGKSSILLAIEFALFGSSRSQLAADSLLRKGATSGSATLRFQIPHKHIEIKRTLKQASQGIRQMPGHIIINGVKQELTALELKAAVFELLGYPPELLQKSSNYLFRYTIYCPQEDMKVILEESAEGRLKTLRKIFNLDRYEQIRANVDLYLKDSRKQLAVARARIEPLSQLQEEERSAQKQHDDLLSQKKLAQKQVLLLDSQVKELAQKLENLETSQREYERLLTERSQHSQQFKQLTAQQEQLVSQEQELRSQVAGFLIDPSLSIEELRVQVQELRKQQEAHIATHSSLKSSLVATQGEMRRVRQELTALDSVEKELATLNAQLSQLENERNDLLSSKDSKHQDLLRYEQELDKQLSELEQSTGTLHAQKDQSNKVLSSLSEMSRCPTCLQDVSEGYKHSMQVTQKEQISQYSEKLAALTEKKTELETAKRLLRKQFNQEQQLAKQEELLSQKRKALLEREQQKRSKQEQLSQLIAKNTQLVTTLSEFEHSESASPQSIKQQILSLERKQEQYQRYDSCTKQHALIKQQVDLISKERQRINSQLELSQNQLATMQDQKEKILGLKEEQKLLGEKHTQSRISLEKYSTSISHLASQLSSLKDKIAVLNAERESIERKQKLQHWLADFFVPLTRTIETQMMGQIYSHFNSLFEQWFELLVQGSSMSAYLDEGFTPIIRQQGYEIPFAHLSGGERTAASLAYRLALNKVINDVISSVHSKGLLVLDEPTDGFSSEQLDRMRDVLENLQLGQIILVSHEAKVESFVENVIRIEKTSGQSKVSTL